MDKNIIIAATALAVITGVLLFADPLQNDNQTEQSFSVPNEKVSTTPQGVRYTVNPDELIQGCSGMDCIPSIDDPKFSTADDSDWLKDSDLVMGVNINGDARAYPLRILNVHEIVNDEVGGENIAVTYCPLCRSGLVYSRDVQNQTLEFGVSGKLWNANLIMYDRQTETYWSQVQGEAVVGPLTPTELELVHGELTNWSGWKAKHPDTRVLSRETGIYPKSTYGSNPYRGYESRESVGFGVGNVDDRLSSKELVYGINVGEEAKAYIEGDIKRENLIQDDVNGVPVLVLEDQESGGIKIFTREIDGSTLEFRLENGKMLDSDGNEWSFDGESLEGEYSGESFDRLNSHGFFWFAWSEFHPDTEIYGQS